MNLFNTETNLLFTNVYGTWRTLHVAVFLWADYQKRQFYNVNIFEHVRIDAVWRQGTPRILFSGWSRIVEWGRRRVSSAIGARIEVP